MKRRIIVVAFVILTAGISTYLYRINNAEAVTCPTYSAWSSNGDICYDATIGRTALICRYCCSFPRPIWRFLSC